MNGLGFLRVDHPPLFPLPAMRTKLISTWVPRLGLPLLFGLAAAFVLTAAWDLYTQDHAVHFSPAQAIAPDAAAPSWAGTILEKNILALDIPEQEEPFAAPRGEDDPASWVHLGTLTGRMPKVLLRQDDTLIILNQDETFKGWKLAEVYPQSVVWTAAGKHREIRLWTKAPDLDPAAASFAPPARQESASIADTKVTLSRKEVQPLLSDPNSLLQMASFKPFSVDGKVSGFQVLSIRPDSLLYKVGLRNGDVLARINGQALTGPTQLLQAYSGMDRASLVTLDVQRASQMLTYLVEIN